MPSEGGFQTAMEFVEAMNAVPQLGTEEALTTDVLIADFYIANDATGQQIVDFIDGMFSSTRNLLLAVQTHLGPEVYQEMLRQVGSGGFEFKNQLDPSSLSVMGDTATVLNASGKEKTLVKTPSGWKMQMESQGEDAQVILMMTEMLGGMSQAMNDAAEQINNGTITSIEELQAAMMSADPF